MKQLQVSDEQYAFIQELREAIAADVVGEYGFVRERDAIRFLIDNLDDDVDLDIDGDLERSAIEDTAASAAAAIEGNPDPQATGTAVSYEEDGESVEATEPEAESDAETEGGAETAEGDTGPADDDEMLNEMMNLLETHDDKWEESSSADYRYTVELPDGSSEDVQTKDDVRALLFQHYR